jgi:hypothetical protein
MEGIIQSKEAYKILVNIILENISVCLKMLVMYEVSLPT